MAFDSTQIEQELNSQLDDCEIQVEGSDGKYQVKIVGDIFAGLNAVKRQQKIYQILNEHISSGAIHAVSMRLLTLAELAASK